MLSGTDPTEMTSEEFMFMGKFAQGPGAAGYTGHQRHLRQVILHR